MDPVQQLGFVIALPHNSFESERGGFALDQRRQLLMRRVPVHVGLAPAQPAQVRAVDDIDRDRHEASSPAYAAASSDGSGPVNRPGLASPSRTTNRSTPARGFLSPAMYSSNSGNASAS